MNERAGSITKQVEQPSRTRENVAKMSAYRFVHLSDIHFGQERDGTLAKHEDVREELLADCESLRQKVGVANGVLVTGDIAYSGKKEEYGHAGEFLDRLTAAIGCKRNSVLVIPGNHDIDLDGIDYTAKMLHEKLRTQSPAQIQADLEGLAQSNSDEHPLHRKLKTYQEFAEQYGCDFESPGRPLWQKDFPLGGGHILRFVGLNSVQVSNKTDAKPLMVLGNTQFTIPREPNIEYIVMIHHPLEWFRDRGQAEEYLYSRSRVLMFGHEHLANINKNVDGNNYERLVIDSGATNPPGTSSEYRYTYNWIDFSVGASGGAYQLSVRVFPRVWVQARTTFTADSTRMALDERESKEFILACTQFRAPLAQATAPADSGSSPARAGSKGDISMDNEEEHFARLRFYFWRYLDWRQRLRVLVQADVLPNTADRPVPQMMERLALSTARSQGKLAVIWDSVMTFVPDGKREANPFPAAKAKD
jgi:hypothetical protein